MTKCFFRDGSDISYLSLIADICYVTSWFQKNKMHNYNLSLSVIYLLIQEGIADGTLLISGNWCFIISEQKSLLNTILFN